jgi:hypothetical protein
VIEQRIAKGCIHHQRGDNYNVDRNVGFVDLIQSQKYSSREEYFILSQAAMLEFAF